MVVESEGSKPTAPHAATLKLALVQMNGATRDVEKNLAKAGNRIDEAAHHGAELVVLPEFFNLPYFAQEWDYSNLDLAESIDGPSISMIQLKARQHGIYICATIYEIAAPGLYYDTAILVGPSGEIEGRYEKVHPAAVKSLEKIYFRPGSKFPVWDVRGLKVAAIICYDHYFPEAARSAMLNGAELVVGPFAAPVDTTALWKELMTVRAFENGVYMAPCNKVGVEGAWRFRGRSMVVGPSGQCIAEANESDETIVYADINRYEVLRERQRFPMVRDRQPDAYESIVRRY